MEEDADFTVSFRSSMGETLANLPITVLAQHSSGELHPVREPPAYRGQSHLPGLFWMTKLGRFVSYESRLEMVILKHLDFDPILTGVLPQPFVLHFTHKGSQYHHTPDFLVWKEGVPPEVINVKPRHHLSDERNQRAFAACGRACERIRWSYSTRSELPPVLLANLNWLAGYRRRPPDFDQYASSIVERALQPIPIRALLDSVEPAALVRPILFHLMWLRQIEFDVAQILSDESLVRIAP